eukprot:gene962-192_t
MPPPGNVASSIGPHGPIPRFNPAADVVLESGGAPRTYVYSNPEFGYRSEQIRLQQMQAELIASDAEVRRRGHREETPLLNSLRANLEFGGPMGIFAPSSASRRPRGKLEKDQQKRIDQTKKELAALDRRKKAAASGSRSRTRKSGVTPKKEKLRRDVTPEFIEFVPDTHTPVLNPAEPPSREGTICKPLPLDASKATEKKKSTRKREPLIVRKAQPLAPSATRTTCFPKPVYDFNPGQRARSRDATSRSKRSTPTNSSKGQAPPVERRSSRTFTGSTIKVQGNGGRGVTPRRCRFGVQNLDVLKELESRDKKLPAAPPPWQQAVKADVQRNSFKQPPVSTPTRSRENMKLGVSPRAAPMRDPIPSSPVPKLGTRSKGSEKTKGRRITPETTAQSSNSKKAQQQRTLISTKATMNAVSAPVLTTTATRRQRIVMKAPVPVVSRKKTPTGSRNGSRKGTPKVGSKKKSTDVQKTVDEVTDQVLSTVQAACENGKQLSPSDLAHLLSGVFMTHSLAPPRNTVRDLVNTFIISTQSNEQQEPREEEQADVPATSMNAAAMTIASSSMLSSPEALPSATPRVVSEALAAAVLNSVPLEEPPRMKPSPEAIPCSLSAANVLNAVEQDSFSFSKKVAERESLRRSIQESISKSLSEPLEPEIEKTIRASTKPTQPTVPEEDEQQSPYVPHIHHLDHILGSSMPRQRYHSAESPPDSESPCKSYLRESVDDALPLGTSGELSISRAESTPSKTRGLSAPLFASPTNFHRLSIDEVDELSEERTPEANLRRRQLRKERRLRESEQPNTEHRINRVTQLFERVETLLNQ